MPDIDELIGASEQVIAIVRKEGEVAKPTDVQCRASINGKRCKEEISFDESGDYWSVFCKKHNAEDNKARKAGDLRITRFDRVSAEEDE